MQSPAIGLTRTTPASDGADRAGEREHGIDGRREAEDDAADPDRGIRRALTRERPPDQAVVEYVNLLRHRLRPFARPLRPPLPSPKRTHSSRVVEPLCPARPRHVARRPLASDPARCRAATSRSTRPARCTGTSEGDGRGGGAERQMMLLARALAARGTSVAHVVFAAPSIPSPLPPGLDLVDPAPEGDGGSLVGGLRETVHVWRALGAADARVTIVRMATPALGVAGAWCRLRGRRLVFSSANDSDFTEVASGSRLPKRLLYRLGLRLADAIVVQSADQVRLARESLPRSRDVVVIPSFCEPPGEEGASVAEPDAFLWIGRLTAVKSPQRFLDLAAALPDARFVLVPVPPSAAPVDSSEVREAARDLPNLTVSDPVPHGELMQLVARAAAIVNTSSVEGMPNVFLEAWARGVPVLTLRCDPDGVVAARGLGVAADGSWERFVAGARELWDTRHDRAELSRRTCAYIEEVHSIDAVAARWAEVLERVVD